MLSYCVDRLHFLLAVFPVSVSPSSVPIDLSLAVFSHGCVIQIVWITLSDFTDNGLTNVITPRLLHTFTQNRHGTKHSLDAGHSINIYAMFLCVKSRDRSTFDFSFNLTALIIENIWRRFSKIRLGITTC